jgi:hypothetical protein
MSRRPISTDYRRAVVVSIFALVMIATRPFFTASSAIVNASPTKAQA